jgi:hypothetical protein
MQSKNHLHGAAACLHRDFLDKRRKRTGRITSVLTTSSSGPTNLITLGGVSRARITQVMNLRNLAPVLQEKILSLPQDHSENSKLKECALRRITGMVDWREQLRQFEQVVRE